MILAIETTSPVTSVALGSTDGAVLGVLSSNEPRGHVEFLMPAIMTLLERDGLGALTGLAVGVGPGLFTSMRVGITTAKTLALTLDVPIAGIGSLDAIAHGVGGEHVCAAVDARRGEVFAARYANGECIEEPAAHEPAALASLLPAGTVVAGNAHRAYPGAFDAFPTTDADPHAAAVLSLGALRLARGGGDDAIALEPMYVRRSDAEIKWEKHGVVIERPLRIRTRGR